MLYRDDLEAQKHEHYCVLQIFAGGGLVISILRSNNACFGTPSGLPMPPWILFRVIIWITAAHNSRLSNVAALFLPVVENYNSKLYNFRWSFFRSMWARCLFALINFYWTFANYRLDREADVLRRFPSELNYLNHWLCHLALALRLCLSPRTLPF